MWENGRFRLKILQLLWSEYSGSKFRNLMFDKSREDRDRHITFRNMFSILIPPPVFDASIVSKTCNPVQNADQILKILKRIISFRSHDLTVRDASDHIQIERKFFI